MTSFPRTLLFGSLLFVCAGMPIAAQTKVTLLSPPTTAVRFAALGRLLPADTTTFLLVDDLRPPLQRLLEWAPAKAMLEWLIREGGVGDFDLSRLDLSTIPTGIAVGCNQQTTVSMGRFVALFAGLQVAEIGRVQEQGEWFDAGLATADKALAESLPLSFTVAFSLPDAEHVSAVAQAIRDAVGFLDLFQIQVNDVNDGQDLVIPIEPYLNRMSPGYLRPYLSPMQRGGELDERQQRIASAMKALQYHVRWRVDGNRIMFQVGPHEGGGLDIGAALADVQPPVDSTLVIGFTDWSQFYEQFVEFDDWLHEDSTRYEELYEHAPQLLDHFATDFTEYDGTIAYRIDVGADIRALLTTSNEGGFGDRDSPSGVQRLLPPGTLLSATVEHMTLDYLLYGLTEAVPYVVGLMAKILPDQDPALALIFDLYSHWAENGEAFNDWIGGEDSELFEPGAAIIIGLEGTGPALSVACVGKLSDPEMGMTIAEEMHERLAKVVGLAGVSTSLEGTITDGLEFWHPSGDEPEPMRPVLHHFLLGDFYVASTSKALTARILEAWRNVDSAPHPKRVCKQIRFQGSLLSRSLDLLPGPRGQVGRALRTFVKELGNVTDTVELVTDHSDGVHHAELVIRLKRGK